MDNSNPTTAHAWKPINGVQVLGNRISMMTNSGLKSVPVMELCRRPLTSLRHRFLVNRVGTIIPITWSY